MPRNDRTHPSDLQRKTEREIIQYLTAQPLTRNLLVERHILYTFVFTIVFLGAGAWPWCLFLTLMMMLAIVSTHAQTPLLVSIIPAIVMPLVELLVVVNAPSGTAWKYADAGVPLWLFPLWGLASHWVLDLQRISFRIHMHLPPGIKGARPASKSTLSPEGGSAAIDSTNGESRDAHV